MTNPGPESTPAGEQYETWDVHVRWSRRHAWLSRRWAGWRRRKDENGDNGSALDAFDIPFDVGDGIAGFFIAILVMIVFGLLLWFLILPLMLLVLDILIVIPLLLLALIGKVAFRRPWVVEATTASGRQALWHVGSWKQAKAVRQIVADVLDRGAGIEEAARAARAANARAAQEPKRSHRPG